MAGLGETVAEALKRRLAPESSGLGRLRAVAAFGADPGRLRMWLHAPADLSPGAPLVVTLHGCGQTVEGYAHGAGWLDLADRYGFAVLAPEQTRANNMNRCFNWFEPQDVARGEGEAASIAAMVAQAMTELALDPRRVFVTGLSAGGAMAAALLAAYPDVFAAGAVIAGLPVGAAATMQEAFGAMRGGVRLEARAWGDKVRAAAPTGAALPRLSIWQGDADATVAPQVAEALALQWTDAHGLSHGEPTETASPRHARRVWRGADGKVLVDLNIVSGMGHGAPLSAGGEAGWGEAAPWLLEVGVPSSLLIAQAWGLTDDATAPRARPHGAAPQASAFQASAFQASPPSGVAEAGRAAVGETIVRALRSAGLLR